jgi:hypothetical protein
MRSISSFDNRPLSLVIVILFDLPVVLSTAETYSGFKMLKTLKC